MRVAISTGLVSAVVLFPATCLQGASTLSRPSPPPYFEPNRGQAPDQVRFVSRRNGFSLEIQATGASLRAPAGSSGSESLQWSLLGANGDAKVEGMTRQRGVSNYFFGADPDRWVRGVPHYDSVLVRDALPGIDLVYRSSDDRSLEYDFLVSPTAAPDDISMTFAGAEVEIDRDGNLVVSTPDGALRQRRPVVYQEIDGRRRPIPGAFLIRPDQSVGFEIGEYDRRRRLVIDPVLEYSTYLGGQNVDSVLAVAVDEDNNTYVAGRTDAMDFRETDRVGGRGNGDVFVTKISAAGDAVLYSTVIGDAGDDAATGMFVNRVGEVYLTGHTRSLFFPTTPGAFRTVYSGGASDAFVSKLTSDGRNLLYSTFIGGSFADFANDIAVDRSGNAYIVGSTNSFNYPTTRQAFQPIRSGSDRDAMLTKLNPAGSDLVYSTFLISNQDDEAYAVSVDANGRAFVGGFAGGSEFPTTFGAAQPICRADGFVTKFDFSGSNLEYSTCLGGADQDEVRDLVVNDAGEAIVVGWTASSDFPIRVENPLIRCGRREDAFGARLNSRGTEIIASGCIGGDRSDVARGVSLDADGNTYIIGDTDSSDFPVTPDAISGTRQGAADVFVTQIDAVGRTLLSSTYLGGGDEDRGEAIAVDGNGVVHIGGSTDSDRFPTTDDALQARPAGLFDGFVARLSYVRDSPVINPDGIVNGADFQRGPVAPGSIVSIFGNSFSIGTSNSMQLPLPTELEGASVNIDGTAAPLFFSSPQQANFQVPVETAIGQAAAIVSFAGTDSPPVAFAVAGAAPALFNQAGLALAQNQDGSMNSAENPAGPGEALVIYFTGVGLTTPPTQTNVGAPTSELYVASLPSSAIIGGVLAEVPFIGLSPGFVGLAQANLIVPEAIEGRVGVQISVGGSRSLPASVFVSRLE